MKDLSSFYKSPEARARKIAGWRAARARTHAGEGFIYLAESIRTGELKIGFSVDPIKRAARAGYNSHRGKCRLLAFVPGTWSQEKALHRALSREPASLGGEIYQRSILSHPAIPEALRAAQASRVPFLTEGRAT